MNEENQNLEDEVRALKIIILNLVKERENDRAALGERLDQLDALQWKTTNISTNQTTNRRALALCLLWIASMLGLGLMLAIDLADGKLDNAKQEMDIIGAAAGTIGGLSVLVASGGADRTLKR